MKILFIDVEELALSVAIRMLDAGHSVRMFFGNTENPFLGKGIVERVGDWKGSIDWADLIFVTTNVEFLSDLEPYLAKGYPIIGANEKAAKWELDRSFGQEIFEAAGIETLPFDVFNDFDKAIGFVKRTGRRYVSKPWGGNADKSLSYVSRDPADMVVKLEKWKATGKMKGEFILQEAIDGCEMAVGGWFGAGGWNGYWNENWEEKRLFDGGLGPNTGEMGTVMRYVKRSKLADKVLLPITSALEATGYTGYCDVNCIVGEDGTPWPLEFTMRFGWPHFQFCMNLHEGDPAEWMLDLFNGKDSLKCKENVIALGVVMAQGDFPWGKMKPEDLAGFPIKGLTLKNSEFVHLNMVEWGKSWLQVGGDIVRAGGYMTAGDFVATVVGLGDRVRKAQKAAYKVVEEISWCNDPFYRTDIGARLEKDLVRLNDHGYAERMVY